MPSELLASPSGHQATLSSTSIEREEIPKPNGPGKKSLAPEGASNLDDQTSQSASVNTAMNRMVDRIVGSEIDECTNGDNNGNNDGQNYGNNNGGNYGDNYDDDNIPPTPPGHTFDDDSPPYDPGNETSYGLMGTLTAQDIISKVHAYSQSPTHSASRSTPRPVLPSVLNSAFAPQPGEVSPQTRPSTATRVSPAPPSQLFLQQPTAQRQSGHSVHSSFSSMPQPSSLAFPHSPLTNAYGFGLFPQQIGIGAGSNGIGGYGNGTVRGRPSTIYGTGNPFDESNLMLSAEVFDGSQWRGSGLINAHTPPNGQGAG